MKKIPTTAKHDQVLPDRSAFTMAEHPGGRQFWSSMTSKEKEKKKVKNIENRKYEVDKSIDFCTT